MWDEECESAVVVEPPDVDVSASLLGLELLDGLDDVVVQSVTVVTPVQAETAVSSAFSPILGLQAKHNVLNLDFRREVLL